MAAPLRSRFFSSMWIDDLRFISGVPAATLWVAYRVREQRISPFELAWRAMAEAPLELPFYGLMIDFLRAS
jgi:hypothetical protein